MIEAKGVSELRAIAKSLDLKAGGLKKAELIDMIASGNGAYAESPVSTAPTPATPRSAGTDAAGENQGSERKRETAPPLEAVQQTTSPDAPHVDSEERNQSPEETSSSAVHDEGATDERRHDERQGRRRPQGRDARSRPREKADGRDGRGRRRRRGRGGGAPHYMRDESWEDLEAEDDPDAEVRTGVLDVLPEGYGFLRTTGYLPGDRDAYVSQSTIRKMGLRRGDIVAGPIRQQKSSDKVPALAYVQMVNNVDVSDGGRLPPRVDFKDMTPLFPDERLNLETPGGPISMRIIDLMSPIGKGQRGLIVSPPKAGKTTILKELGQAIVANNPEVHLMVVLVDERPEEVTDMQRSVKGEIIASTFDRPADDHTQIAELAMERAKRLVEQGQDVVVLLDSITRLARAYNLSAPASGRIMSGGVNSTALYPPKRFFGAARNIEGGGSLTI